MKSKLVSAGTVVAAGAMIAASLLSPTLALAASDKSVVEKSKAMVPMPPWAKGDQVGMANTLGAGTWLRCAAHLMNPKSKAYEVSHERSNTMPMSPFGVPLKYKYSATKGVPYSLHAWNGEVVVSGEPGAQGTQMDALGHFAVIGKLWKGEGKLDAGKAKYYGGYTQSDVKPSDDSPLLKLGIEKVPPIITSAVLLDAKSHLGGGQAMKPGQLVTTQDIEAMLAAQGLSWRGILPGDVVYIYTGWSDNWKDPDLAKSYYFKGPGLAYDAAKYLKSKAVVLVALDNPFTDPVNDGQLVGKAPPAKGTPQGLPFAIHHENLSVSASIRSRTPIWRRWRGTRSGLRAR